MSKPKHWQIAQKLSPQAEEALVKFPAILRQILFNRGFATDAQARLFLKAEASSETDPFLMTGMELAVARIVHAIKEKESVAVYGDYDVDGVTATALLVETIQALDGNARPYIPKRADEGYGLNPKALDLLKAEGVGLVITVDSGIRSPAEVSYACSIGLDLIVSDHHQPAEGELPPALAVINPKQAGDQYPDKDLAGVGVAYKIAQALLSRIEKPANDFQLEDLLDLVALGTVADLVPLVGENRVLVRQGLQKIRETKRQGLFSLAAVADLSLVRTTALSIGFILGPRLNAAGRMESAKAAYELLTTKDVKQAGELAQQLNIQNRQRQEFTRKIQEQAEAMVQADEPDSPLLFAVSPEFNSGVVGLAAARLVETYYRPAVVGQVFQEEGMTRCSCRSIPEFQITEALDQCKDLLVRYGGHAAAAGFTVSNDNLETLKNRLKALATERLGSKDLRQTLIADAEVPLSNLHSDLISNLNYLQPTGYGNPEAVFVTRNVRISSSRAVGTEGKHLKLAVTDGHITFDAIGFRLGHLQSELPPNVDLIYTFETNEFNGRTSLQLNLKDIKPAGTPD